MTVSVLLFNFGTNSNHFFVQDMKASNGNKAFAKYLEAATRNPRSSTDMTKINRPDPAPKKRL